MPWSWAMVHMTAGSTLPPTGTCSSARGPSEEAWKLAGKRLGSVGLGAVQLHLEPMALERDADGGAFLDVCGGVRQVAGVDLHVGQLEPAPGHVGLGGDALLGVLQAGLQRRRAIPVLAEDAIDERLLLGRVEDNPAVVGDLPEVVEVVVADLVVG